MAIILKYPAPMCRCVIVTTGYLCDKYLLINFAYFFCSAALVTLGKMGRTA